MASDPKVAIIAEPTAFFSELIQNAAKAQRKDLPPPVHLYLVELLKHFIHSENFYIRDSEGKLREEPLAFLWKEALEERAKENQRQLFRYIGDVSLYVSGMFPESCSADVEYYIGMGEAAYRGVSQRVPEPSAREVFYELSRSFETWVQLLAVVNQKTTPTTETNLVRIYDRWLRTGSEQAAQTLKEAGILSKKTGSGYH